jgi:hypothetical protein
MLNEEFDVLGEEDLVLLRKRFERMYLNRKNARRSSVMFYKCGKHGHFIAKCPEAVEKRSRTSTVRGTSTCTARGMTRRIRTRASGG